MENYKLASQQKLRFQTSKGPLSAEQLWDLSLDELDTLAVSLQEQHENSGKKSFLNPKSEKDKTAKLKFDIVLDVLNTKQEEAQALTKAKEIKAHNDKIYALIAKSDDKELEGKTRKQLVAMLQ